MRMKNYFAIGALLALVGLAATLTSGLVLGGERHLWIGLFTATLCVAVHTLVILFMLITGRILREAMRARDLGREFLEELNRFFSRRKAYPLTVFAALAIVATGVLGFASRGFGISPWVHAGLGLGAVALNAWTLLEQARTLSANQDLIDRAARTLDQLDRQRAQAGLAEAESDPAPPTDWRKLGLTWGIGAWLPYLYWALINYRGDFSRVSLHPWIEISAAGFLVHWLARKGASARRT